MPSKSSKPIRNLLSRIPPARSFSEEELVALGKELGALLAPPFRLALNGPMGAGKSTFARAVLEGLRTHRMAEGSPTFAIAHEYRTAGGTRVIHADLYRLKSEAEIENAGLIEGFWGENVVSIAEWTDRFPAFHALYAEAPEGMALEIRFDPKDSSRREIAIVAEDA